MPKPDFGAVVIGAGVVGISVARALAARMPTALLEQLTTPATLTSARNSGVVHAGLYYPLNSLKTRLCIQGAALLQSFCQARDVPYSRVGKLLVAQSLPEGAYLQNLHDHANALGVHTQFISRSRLNIIEPDVCANEIALLSSTTAIVDTSALIAALLADFEAQGGDLAISTKVTGIRPADSGSGWIVDTECSDGKCTSVSADCVINAAGHGSCTLANLTSPEKFTPYYCKGTYFSYSGPMRPKHLVYPCPDRNLASLGIHLNLDVSGKVRFGPDVQWIDNPNDYKAQTSRIPDATIALSRYIRGIKSHHLAPDFAGIRPKLGPPNTFQDFILQNPKPGIVNLLGIESPGLTSALAIAEEVEKLLNLR